MDLLLLFSDSVMSNSLHPKNCSIHSFPICSNSCPLNQWGHPTISSSVATFSSFLQCLPASGSFPMSQFFTSDGQSIGVSASASVLINIQDWFPLGLTTLISLQSKGLSRVLSSTKIQKHQFFGLSLLHGPTLTSIQDHWKNHSFDYTDLCQQSDVSAFWYAVWFAITFFLRSKHLLISWLQSPSAVILYMWFSSN